MAGACRFRVLSRFPELNRSYGKDARKNLTISPGMLNERLFRTFHLGCCRLIIPRSCTDQLPPAGRPQ